MFYGIGGISTGIQRRQKEQRVERAAIREEFERWKANNPNATAMDFHTKVKQLGAQTPGGSTVMPDASSIQRMAAENLRRKQEEEADRARKLRVDNLNMSMTQSTFLNQQIAAGMPVNQALTAAGYELSDDNFKMAEGVKTNLDAEQAQKEAQLAQEKYDRAFKQEQALYQLELNLKDQYPFMTDQDATRIVSERFSQFSGPPATAPNTYGPMPTSSAPSAPMSVGNAGVQIAQRQFEEALPALFENNPGKYAGPNGYEMLKRDAVQLAQREGSTLPPAQIAQALEATNFVRQYDESLDDTRFNAALKGDEPSSLSITIGEGKNAIPISLKDIYESQLNNGGVLDSRVIPFDKLDEFQAIVAPFFSVNKDGTADLTPLTNMGNQLAGLKGQLDQAGIFDKSELATLREQAVLNEGQAESGAALLDGQRKELEGVVAEVKAQLAAAGSLYEQQQILAQQKVRMDYFKSLTLNDRIAEIYANGGVYPLDVLPASMHSSYDRQAFASTFDDAYESMLAFGRENAASVMVSSEVNEAETEAKFLDRAMETSSEPVTEDASNAAVEALGDFGFARGLLRGWKADDSGEMSQQYPTNTELSRILVQGGASQKAAVTHAMASAFEAFEAQRGTGLQYDRPKGRQGLMSIIAGFIDAEVSAVNQAMSQFPGYNRAVADATRQFRVTLETTAGTNGLSSDEIIALEADFNAYIKQATRQRRFVGSNSFGGEPIQNVTQMDLMAPSDQGLPSGARIIQR